jgi:hypothetical protein
VLFTSTNGIWSWFTNFQIWYLKTLLHYYFKLKHLGHIAYLNHVAYGAMIVWDLLGIKVMCQVNVEQKRYVNLGQCHLKSWWYYGTQW